MTPLQGKRAHVAPGKKQFGFTLVELMIALLIASILMSIVAPGMASLIEGNRVQASSESLFTSLMLTRSEALKRNRDVTMWQVHRWRVLCHGCRYPLGAGVVGVRRYR